MEKVSTKLDELCISIMNNSGIPIEARKTTLSKEGYEFPQLWVKQVQEGKDDERIGVVALPMTRKNGDTIGAVDSMELLHYLIAKQFALSGTATYCTSVMELDELWQKRTADESVQAKVEACKCLCISNFIEDTPPALPAYAYHYIAYRLRKRYDEGRSLVLMCPDGVRSLLNWWPPSFVHLVSSNATLLIAKQ